MKKLKFQGNCSYRLPRPQLLLLFLTVPIFSLFSIPSHASELPETDSLIVPEPIIAPEPLIVVNEFVLTEPVVIDPSQYWAFLFLMTVNVGLVLANFLVTHTKPISLGRF